MSDKGGEFLKGLLIGGMVGAILGILYAPKSGKETRAEIGNKTDELLTKARSDYERALERSKKTYESALKRLKELETAAKGQVGHLEEEEEVEGMAERSKEALLDGKTRFKKALDAGIDAFKEDSKA